MILDIQRNSVLVMHKVIDYISCMSKLRRGILGTPTLISGRSGGHCFRIYWFDRHAPEDTPPWLVVGAWPALTAHKSDLLAIPVTLDIDGDTSRELECEGWVEREIAITKVGGHHILAGSIVRDWRCSVDSGIDLRTKRGRLPRGFSTEVRPPCIRVLESAILSAQYASIFVEWFCTGK
jgi:hypothetical protein